MANKKGLKKQIELFNYGTAIFLGAIGYGILSIVEPQPAGFYTYVVIFIWGILAGIIQVD